MEINIEEMTIDTLPLVATLNQPFEVVGRLIPTYDGQQWHSAQQLLDEPYTYTYPPSDEPLDDYLGSPERQVLLAFARGQAVGYVRYRRNWNGYCFIEDLAVAQSARGQGVGLRLLAAAEAWARGQELKGFALETQDINLLACRFYTALGFELGAVDSRLYDHTPARGQLALFWYRKFSAEK